MQNMYSFLAEPRRKCTRASNIKAPEADFRGLLINYKVYQSQLVFIKDQVKSSGVKEMAIAI